MDYHIRNHDHLTRGILLITVGMWFALFGIIVWKPIDTFGEVASDIASPQKIYPIFTGKRVFYLIGLVLSIVLIPYVWVAGILMKKLIAEQEYRADIGAVQITGNPEAISNAVTKLALAYEAPIDDIYQPFMLFDIVKPTYPRKLTRRMYEFYRAPIKDEVVKRNEELAKLKGFVA